MGQGRPSSKLNHITRSAPNSSSSAESNLRVDRERLEDIVIKNNPDDIHYTSARMPGGVPAPAQSTDKVGKPRAVTSVLGAWRDPEAIKAACVEFMAQVRAASLGLDTGSICHRNRLVDLASCRHLAKAPRAPRPSGGC